MTDYSIKFDIVRVQLGKLDEFIKTACLTSLTFLGAGEESLGIKIFNKI